MFETIFLPSKHEKKLRKNFEVRREKIIIMPCASKETLGKEPLYRVLKKHTAKIVFAMCYIFAVCADQSKLSNTRQTAGFR